MSDKVCGVTSLLKKNTWHSELSGTGLHYSCSRGFFFTECTQLWQWKRVSMLMALWELCGWDLLFESGMFWMNSYLQRQLMLLWMWGPTRIASSFYTCGKTGPERQESGQWDSSLLSAVSEPSLDLPPSQKPGSPSSLPLFLGVAQVLFPPFPFSPRPLPHYSPRYLDRGSGHLLRLLNDLVTLHSTLHTLDSTTSLPWSPDKENVNF